jgi:hypothetical protein
MKAIKIFLLVGIVTIVYSGKMKAQDTLLDGRLMISMVPQYFINNGLRVDLDLNISGNQWLTVGPQFYYSSSRNNHFQYEGWDDENSYDIKEIVGFGLDVYHKFFLNLQPHFEGVYLGYGLVYQSYWTEYSELEWGTYTDQGNEYLQETEMHKNEVINKFGINIMIGYHITYKEFGNLFLDGYLGVGFRYSTFKTQSYEDSYFVNDILSLGYRGNIPVAGIRGGLVID